MKRILCFFGIAFMGFMNLVVAQNVLVTDDGTFSAPATLLHVHKTGASGNNLQLTNGTTGTASSNGFKVDIDASKNVELNNQESASMKFATGNATHMTMDSAGNVTMTGQLVYLFPHGVTLYSGTGYQPPITAQNTFVEILPGLTNSETDGLTISGDQITILTAGDYKIEMAMNLQGGDKITFRVKARKNSGSYTDLPGSFRVSTPASPAIASLSYFWYVPLAVNDVISFWIENTTDNTKPTIYDMKVYIEKKPQ
jgi:hypothetical protein